MQWEIVGESGMYFGSFNHTLDEKGRLSMPRKFRDLLGEKAYILKGYEGSLSIYDQASFANYIAALTSLPYSHKDARDVQRVALSSAYELEVDRVGRISLPSMLLTKYAISRNVVVVGVVDHIEIWDKTKWEEYLANSEKDFEEKSEHLPL